MFVRFKEDTTFIKDIENLLKDKIQGKIVNHEVKPLTEFGENFGSEMVKVDITVEEPNGRQNTMHAVGKLIPPTEMQLNIFNTQVTFKNEIGFYGDIVETLKLFQKENGVEVMSYFPEMYGARISLNPKSKKVDNDAVIVMENLKMEGYGNIDRIKGFDLEGAKKVLRNLANFQATALAFRKTRPEEFNSKINPYLKIWKVTKFPLHLDTILEQNPSTAYLIDKVNVICEKDLTKTIREPWATITHNDLWVNNIMVIETNDSIEKVKFVDFQVIDLSSPLHDVLFFLLSSVQLSVIRFHFDKLLRYYYSEFIKVLQSFKIDIKDFTYESYEKEILEEGQYQLYHCLFMTNVIMGPKGMPKKPGKAPQWNPKGKLNNYDRNEKSNQRPKSDEGPPVYPVSVPVRDQICFMVEEAAKRKWI